MRQHFVPRISLHAKLEVATPNVGRNARLNEACCYMIVDPFVVARLVSSDRRDNRRYDIIGTALRGKEDLNARTRGFRRFNENELVPVRNDHRRNRVRMAMTW